MILLSVLIVLGLVQLWGSGAPVHHDKWFKRWVLWIHRQMPHAPGVLLFFALAGPVLGLAAVVHFVSSVQSWLTVFIAIPVLLYCLGRGEFSTLIQSYLTACTSRNWENAIDAAKRLGIADTSIEGEQWSKLHSQVLFATSYKGFERMFAVLFWFMLLGPVGALLYRLSFLYVGVMSDKADRSMASRWLWLLEWPAVRVLGLSFAFTGNFVSCIQHWREFIACTESSSDKVLVYAIRGALTLGERIALDVSDTELRALQSLLSRTLLLWICLLALSTLIL